jgi:hypothetical protein
MKKLLSIALCSLGFAASAQLQVDNLAITSPASFAQHPFTYVSDNGAGDTLYKVEGNFAFYGNADKNFYFRKHNQYLLSGYVFVDSLVTLNIPAGTVIKGDKATKGTLIIKRGAKLKAIGTNTDPIIFTSALPAGQRAAGDWGGVVICGSAPNNISNNVQLEGNYGAFHGGTNAADNSGTIKFVRIEFSGIALNPNQEINGLTMGSVGSGTVLHHIQVSHNGDDSFEWFGGTVNSRYLIAYNTVDDMFDADNGFSGFNQWGIGISDPSTADVSKSNGFECDNNSGGTTATPRTKTIFSNYALFGPYNPNNAGAAVTSISSNFASAAHLRRSTQIGVHNSVFVGWPKGLLLDGTTTLSDVVANTTGAATSVTFANNVFSNINPAGGSVSGGVLYSTSGTVPAGFAIADWAATNNNTEISWTDLKYQNPYGTALNTAGVSFARNFAAKVGNPLASGASFTAARLTTLPTGLGAAGLSNSVAYRGLGGNWGASALSPWMNYSPQTTNYDLGNYGSYMAPEAVVAERSIEATQFDFENVAIFPNPANEQTMFSVEFNNAGTATISIYNVAGQLVNQTRQTVDGGLNEFFFNTSSLENGLYIVSITNGAEVKSNNLMVDHN